MAREKSREFACLVK
ncbi:hypothetical protein CP03DC29_0266A, partial [Chlamydia psittaci 03DC29]